MNCQHEWVVNKIDYQPYCPHCKNYAYRVFMTTKNKNTCKHSNLMFENGQTIIKCCECDGTFVYDDYVKWKGKTQYQASDFTY